jgi:uncharacterized protein YndB with AHSA1/START domain
MTTQKTLKHRVRARAAKTGESYTAARSQLLRKADPISPPPDTMALTGMTDDAMERGSGRTLAAWLEILDAWGATERKHPEIARWLVAEHGIPGWWAQSVTVGYEKARGMRAVVPAPGGFSVTVSRTIAVAPERVTEAFTEERMRERWLPGAPISVRTVRPGRSARFDWAEPTSRIAFNLASNGERRTQISLIHERLPDADAAQRMKVLWRGALAALKELLEAG